MWNRRLLISRLPSAESLELANSQVLEECIQALRLDCKNSDACKFLINMLLRHPVLVADFIRVHGGSVLDFCSDVFSQQLDDLSLLPCLRLLNILSASSPDNFASECRVKLADQLCGLVSAGRVRDDAAVNELYSLLFNVYAHSTLDCIGKLGVVEQVCNYIDSYFDLSNGDENVVARVSAAPSIVVRPPLLSCLRLISISKAPLSIDGRYILAIAGLMIAAMDRLQRRCLSEDLPEETLVDILQSTILALYNIVCIDLASLKLLKSALLPDSMDRSRALNNGSETYNIVIRHLTQSSDEAIKLSLQEFLWELCGKSVDRFNYYLGYGNAAGFLMRMNMMNISKDSQALTDDGQPISRMLEDIDLMTGALKSSSEALDDGMTEEEREAEGERIAGLMERLARTGVVKFQ